MTSTASKQPLLSHHVTANPPSGVERPVRWRGPVKNSDFVVSNNVNNNGNGGGTPKRPSYVGLSCSVSGYGAANRYTSPDGRRTSPEQIPVRSGPQILDSVGLVLAARGSMRQQQASNNNNNGSSMKNGHDVTDRSYFASSSSTTTRVFSSYREPSPGSDSGSSSAGSGNLVQKQIERIYGGKVQSVSATSPPDSDDAMSPPAHAHGDSNATPQRKSSGGGFFSRKFGLSKQKDRKLVEEERSRNGSNGDSAASNSPLDFKPLKVPAVFRLLRPEFREQLKSNSCQIPGDRTSPVKEPHAPSAAARDDAAKTKKERVIPVVVENGAANKPTSNARIIPVQRTSERITDTASKPTSLPVTITRTTSSSENSVAKPASSSPLDPEASHSVTSPGLVMSSGILQQQQQKSASPPKPVEERREEAPPPATPTRRSESPPPPQHSPQRSFDSTGENGPTLVQEPILEEDGEEEAAEEAEKEISAEDFDTAAAGGIHEMGAQLCTIMEEDNESTASGSQLNLLAAKNGAPMAAKRSSALSNGNNGVEGTEHAQQEVHDGHYFMKVCSPCLSEWRCYDSTSYRIQIWIQNHHKAENCTPDPDPRPESYHLHRCYDSAICWIRIRNY